MYASCSRLACTAPAAAIAALTPQIDTADGSSARSRSSSPSRPPSHQVNPNTTLIRTSACRMAGPAARDDHRDVDRRAEQHEPGLDEELGAEAAGQPVAQAEPGEHDVAEQAQQDRVDRVLDRRGDAAERGALGRGGHGLLQEAGERRRARDDGDAGRAPSASRGRAASACGRWSVLRSSRHQPAGQQARSAPAPSSSRPTTVAAQSSLRASRRRRDGGVAADRSGEWDGGRVAHGECPFAEGPVRSRTG